MASPRLYIGGAAITAWHMDAGTGKITAIGDPVEQDGAGSFLWPSADGAVLYAVAKPGMAAFKIDSATGTLRHVNTIANALDGNSHISTNGKVVIGSAYGGADGATSGVNVAKIRADGGLEDSATSVPHEGGSGVHQGVELCQDGSHCHSGYVDPSGGYVLVRPELWSAPACEVGVASLHHHSQFLPRNGWPRRCQTSARTRYTRMPLTTAPVHYLSTRCSRLRPVLGLGTWLSIPPATGSTESMSWTARCRPTHTRAGHLGNRQPLLRLYPPATTTTTMRTRRTRKGTLHLAPIAQTIRQTHVLTFTSHPTENISMAQTVVTTASYAMRLVAVVPI
eukprot:COSAG02_NODE_14158_length_1303_cov_1.568106_1_plen_336_part_10